MCLQGRIFISRLGAAQASILTGKVLKEFSAQRDEFSSAKLWVLPTKVDPIRSGGRCVTELPLAFGGLWCWQGCWLLLRNFSCTAAKKIATILCKQIIAHLLYWLPTYNQWNHVRKCLEAQTNWRLFHFRTTTHAIWEIAFGTAKMGVLVTHEEEDSLPNNSYLDVHKLVPNLKCKVNFSTEHAKRQMKMYLPWFHI